MPSGEVPGHEPTGGPSSQVTVFHSIPPRNGVCAECLVGLKGKFFFANRNILLQFCEYRC